MTVFNRAFIVLLGIAFMVIGLVFLFEPQRSLLVAEDATNSLRSTQLAWPAFGATVAAIGAILLVFELIPRRRRLLAQVESGIVEYSPAMVGRMLEQDLMSMEGLQSARVRVSGTERRVDVHAALEAEPESDAHDLVARAGNRMRERLEHGLGLGIGSVRMAIEQGQLDRGRHDDSLGSRAA